MPTGKRPLRSLTMPPRVPLAESMCSTRRGLAIKPMPVGVERMRRSRGHRSPPARECGSCAWTHQAASLPYVRPSLPIGARHGPSVARAPSCSPESSTTAAYCPSRPAGPTHTATAGGSDGRLIRGARHVTASRRRAVRAPTGPAHAVQDPCRSFGVGSQSDMLLSEDVARSTTPKGKHTPISSSRRSLPRPSSGCCPRVRRRGRVCGRSCRPLRSTATSRSFRRPSPS